MKNLPSRSNQPTARSASHLSRRDFLKTGCLGAAAAGLAVCGLSAAIPLPDPTPTDLSSSYGDNSMNKHILVTYASALGSTAEVAAEIAKTLGANGSTVDLRPMQEKPSINGYQAVVIGSAVQHGNWLPEAVAFVKANQAALKVLPTALFTVHITNLGDDQASRKKRLAYLDPVRPLLRPVSEVFFPGKFDRRGAALMLPGWLARFVPPLDFRNWKKIRSWAESVQAQLLQ